MAFFTRQFVSDLADFGQTLDIKPAETLALADKEGADDLVSYDTVVDIIHHLHQNSEYQELGLLMGEQVNLKATAFLDQLMDSCSTVQAAFEVAISYSRLISDSMICSLQVDEDEFRVNFELNPDWSVKDDYAVIQNLNLALLCAKNSLQRLTQSQYTPSELNFYYPKPRKLQEHLRLFNCRLNFGQKVSSIVFRKSLLHQSSVRQDAGLREGLERQAEEVIRQLPVEAGFLMEVKHRILRNISPQSYDLVQLADEMSLSPRTLQRRLKKHHTSYKSLQNQLRLQLASKMLKANLCTLDEIAYLLGYAEASVLARAFKKWTGESPRRYIQA